LFRHFNLTAFVSKNSAFVWGGVMMMRKADIDRNVCQIKSRWLQGGYTEDLLALGCATEGRMATASPLQALFPNELRCDITFEQAWSFLRRQIFVLTTYGSRRTRPYHVFLQTVLVLGYGLPIVSSLAALLTWTCVLLTPAASWQVLCTTAILSCFQMVMWLLLAFALKSHLQASVRLTAALSPERPTISTAHGRYTTLFVSFICAATLIPIAVVASLCSHSITWAGVTYRVQSGKVASIIRPGQPASLQEQQQQQQQLGVRSD